MNYNLINKILLGFLFVLALFINYVLYNFKSNYKTTSNLRINDPLDDYIKLHNKIRQNGSQKVVLCRRIRPGYANKMYNVLSSLTIAVLTDKAISISWPEINDFVQPPLIDVFKEPKVANLSKISPWNSNNWAVNKKIDVLLSQKVPDYDQLVFEYNLAYFFYLTSNPIYYDKILKYKLASEETVQRAKENYFLYVQNKTNVTVEPFLSIGFQVAHRLVNKFWVLNVNFSKSVEQVYKSNFERNYVIGIQIRYQFLKKNETNLNSFFQCALQIQKSNLKNLTVKYFVTSDSEYVFDVFKKKFPNQIIEGVGKIGHTNYDQNSYFRTVLDNELLAKANQIIITGGSTFGFMSAIRKGSLPYYIDGIDENIPCRKMNFSHLPRSRSGIAIF